MRFNASTRILHFSIILVVAFQLISSVWMLVPEPGKMLGFRTTLFTLHITLFGWAAFILGGTYALMRYYDREAWGRLVPWFSLKHMTEFFRSSRRELPGIVTGKLAPPEDKGALAGAVQGLGFLLLIALGATGIYVELGWRSDGTMADDILLFLDFHSLFGDLIWIFVCGHILMTLYHLAKRQRRILDIFKRGKIRWD